MEVSYTRWIFHGENLNRDSDGDDSDDGEDETIANDNNEVDEMQEILEDIHRGTFLDVSIPDSLNNNDPGIMHDDKVDRFERNSKTKMNVQSVKSLDEKSIVEKHTAIYLDGVQKDIKHVQFVMKTPIRNDYELKLLIPEGENRPVGDDSCKLSREIGIVVRQFAPIKISGWHEIADVDKLALYERIVRRSTANSSNRGKLPYIHRAGTRTFVATRHKLGCYHNGKGWANDGAKKRYETMVNMQSQPPSDENEVPMTEQEICAQVLGTRYGYIPGRGHGPKPKSRREVSENQSSQLQEELINTKTVLETQQSQIETQQSQIETQQSQIEAQRKEIEWLKTMVQQIIQMPSRNEDYGPSTTW
uniref:Transposase Tnp1/En/Spm-like domain-containing protein n=1 Tax=Ananas comosus var. bracteatus TaxID=296719 RepID=A0A6V7NJ46_ANACO|nr:unnamed protein product [Ananas comosus var. bracteatus]